MSLENHRCEDADFSDYLAPPHFFVRKKKIAKKGRNPIWIPALSF
jgi:hypothetical protein